MNKGATAYYRVIDKLEDFLKNSPDVNTITTGDITQVDLNKQNLFPLCHIMVNSCILKAGVVQFNISVFAMDIVWQSKKNPSDPNYNTRFLGITNEQDVLNTQLKVINLLNESMLRKTLRGDLYELVGDGTAEPFKDRFENDLAGWVYSFDVFVKNDIDTCQN